MARYVVTLTSEERETLLRLVSVGKGAARKLAHARILLKADMANGQLPATDKEIAAGLEVSDDTVARVRRRFVEDGFEAALDRRPAARGPRERVIASTTSTNARAWATCSCLSSRWQAGGT